MMKEKVLSTFAGNAKLARVATGLDDSSVPEKKIFIGWDCGLKLIK